MSQVKHICTRRLIFLSAWMHKACLYWLCKKKMQRTWVHLRWSIVDRCMFRTLSEFHMSEWAEAAYFIAILYCNWSLFSCFFPYSLSWCLCFLLIKDKLRYCNIATLPFTKSCAPAGAVCVKVCLEIVCLCVRYLVRAVWYARMQTCVPVVK